MTRLIALLSMSVALSAVAAPVHVASVAQSPTFLASDGWPAIWLPDPDAGLPDSSATVFVAGNVAAGQGVPVAFALDGGAIPLTINFDPAYAPAVAIGGWVKHTNMGIGYDYAIGGGVRNVVSTGAYRYFVYDGVGQLDDVTYVQNRLGPTAATAFEVGPVIFAAYGTNLNAYHPLILDGGIAYDTNYTGGSAQGSQAVMGSFIGAVLGIPEEGELLVGLKSPAELWSVTRTLNTKIRLDDAGQLGTTLEGLGLYHVSDVGDGGRADWALVSTDGHLLLYQVKPNFEFVTELVIDSANPAPYFQGVAVSSLPLGPYDQGVVVVFASSNVSTGSGQLLFARWDDIVGAVDAGLGIDTSFDPRTYYATGPLRGDAGKGYLTPPTSSGITSHTSLSGGCGGVPPPLTVVGSLLALAGLARRRRR